MKIEIVRYEDWVQLFADGVEVFAGHSIPDYIWIEILRKFCTGEGYSFEEESIDLSNWGPFFAYNGTAVSFRAAQQLHKEFTQMEADGCTLNEWGEWSE